MSEPKEPGAEARAAEIVNHWFYQSEHCADVGASREALSGLKATIAAAVEAKERELRAVQDELANLKSGALNDYSLEIETLQKERDTLAQQLAAAKADAQQMRDERDATVLHLNETRQQLADKEEQLSKWMEGCTDQRIGAEKAEQQLEQAVRQIDMLLASAHPHPEEQPTMFHAWQTAEQLLASPAIAPIRERVRQGWRPRHMDEGDDYVNEPRTGPVSDNGPAQEVRQGGGK